MKLDMNNIVLDWNTDAGNWKISIAQHNFPEGKKDQEIMAWKINSESKDDVVQIRYSADIPSFITALKAVQNQIIGIGADHFINKERARSDQTPDPKEQ